MDNTLVSARISRAKKERGYEALASIGATASDLINSAFDYVIAAKELPFAQKANAPDAQAFAAFVDESTFDIDWPAGFDGDYRQLMSHMRIEDYEALDRYQRAD